jgi:CubicO group peptidase (beta-lactamase class C family)
MTTDGFTAAGFDGVRAAFDKNFAEGLEVGAAFAAYRRGELVVDLWGGVADDTAGRPWERDTIALVFSTTKGAAAVCAHQLVDRGLLELDVPVAKYWPEFAQAGKADVPVDFLLSHRAGLPYVDEKLTLEQVVAWDPLIRAFERQTPIWAPGTQHGYHALTYGYLVGEVVRRITGMSIGTHFAREVAAPLALDFWIGLPEEHEARVAPLVGGLMADTSNLDPDTRAMMEAFIGPETILGKSMTLGGAFAAEGAHNVFNTRAVHAAEIPAAAGITDARSLARMYAACIGEVDGVRLLSDARMRDASTQRTEGPDAVLMGLDLQWGLGFMVPGSMMPIGGPHSFGHFGAGGSMGWADPDAELSFGYVMNRMDMGMAGDQRSSRLVNACYEALR